MYSFIDRIAKRSPSALTPGDKRELQILWYAANDPLQTKQLIMARKGLKVRPQTDSQGKRRAWPCAA